MKELKNIDFYQNFQNILEDMYLVLSADLHIIWACNNFINLFGVSETIPLLEFLSPEESKLLETALSNNANILELSLGTSISYKLLISYKSDGVYIVLQKYDSSGIDTLTFLKKLTSTSANLLYIYDIDKKRNIFSNDSLERVLGYTPLNVLEFGDNMLEQIVHPDDYHEMIFKLGRMRLNKRGDLLNSNSDEKSDIISRFKKANGDWAWIWSRITVFKRKDNGEVSQLFGEAIDISSQKKAESDIINSERKLRTINKELLQFKDALNTSLIVASSDLDGKIISANDNFIAISDYKENELIGQSFNLLNPGFHRNIFFQDMWDTISSGQIWKGEIKNISKDEQYFWLSTIIIPIFNSDGNISSYWQVSKDITAMKYAEDELVLFNLELEARVEQRTVQLSKLNEEKDEILGTVSHDLKNPLSSIILSCRNAKMLIDLNKYELIKDKLDRIEATAQNIAQSVNNLLDISQYENGFFSIKLEYVDIDEIMDRLILNYADRIYVKNQDLIYSNNCSIQSINTDKEFLFQILDNLLSNAIKYTYKKKNIYLNVFEDNDSFYFSLRDEGQGIPENELGKLYDKFTKLSPQPTGGEGSSGLGMSIVKKLLELLGGEIDCESEIGKGTTFLITLPKR